MTAIFPRLRRPIAWLLCTALLCDGLLVGLAHNHGLAGYDPSGVAADPCHACSVTAAQTPVGGHGHAGCGHSHRRPAVSPEGCSHEEDSHHSDEPHRHDDCAACRYLSLASLSEFPLMLPPVDEVHSSSWLPAASAPVSRLRLAHQARAPPVV